MEKLKTKRTDLGRDCTWDIQANRVRHLTLSIRSFICLAISVQLGQEISIPVSHSAPQLSIRPTHNYYLFLYTNAATCQPSSATGIYPNFICHCHLPLSSATGSSSHRHTGFRTLQFEPSYAGIMTDHVCMHRGFLGSNLKINPSML